MKKRMARANWAGAWVVSKKKPKQLVFKHEGEQGGRIIGPLWVEFKAGSLENYRDSRDRRGEGFFPEWFTLANARKIAKSMRLPLEEV